MSWLTFLATVAALWVVTGALSAIVMHRRGHRWVSWLLLGLLFGPLVLPLLPIATGVDRVRRSVTLRPGTSGAGDLDLVVGIDGSATALDAARVAVALFAPRLRSVALVTVRDYESSSEPPDQRVLLEAASTLALPNGIIAELVEAHGRPAEALARTAADRGAVLVIGERGTGLASLGLGTVTSAIRGQARGPYLVIGGAASSTTPAEGTVGTASGDW